MMAKPSSPTRSSTGSDYSRHERYMSGLPTILRVQVLSCCDLPAADSNGKSDPYVIIKFGDQIKKTRVVNETLDPVYSSDATFDIYISEDDVKSKGALLHFTVMDRDLIRDDHLAGCSLSPSDWFRGVDSVDSVPAYAFHDTGNHPVSYSLYARNPIGSPTIQLKLGLVPTELQRRQALDKAAMDEAMIHAVDSLEDLVHIKAEREKYIRSRSPVQASKPRHGFLKFDGNR